MNKKLNVSDLSLSLKPVIILAITEHLKPTIAKFIEENNCIKKHAPLGSRQVGLVCYVEFDDLRIPIKPDFFNNQSQGIEIKNFRANPFVSDLEFCHESHVWFFERELVNKATRHVAKQVYKFITSDF